MHAARLLFAIVLAATGGEKKDPRAVVAKPVPGVVLPETSRARSAHDANDFTYGLYSVDRIYETNETTFVQLSNRWGADRNLKPIPLTDLQGLRPRAEIGQLP